LGPFFVGESGEISFGRVDAAFSWGNGRSGIVDWELIGGGNLFGPLGDSSLRLRASLRAVAGEMSHLSALETHRVVGRRSGRALCIATLSGSPSHRASSPRRGPRAVKVHGDGDVSIGRWSRGRVVLGWFRILSPIRVLVPTIVAVLLVRGILEPSSLVVTLVSSRLRSSGAEDIFDHLARLDTLDGFLLGSFVRVWDRWPEDVFDHTPREAFYEELDGLRVPEMIPCDSSEALEVVGVLVNFGPLQAEGFQFRSSALLSLGVLVLGRKLREELFPYSGDVVNWLERIYPLSHGSRPFGDKGTLNEGEGKRDSLNVRPHASHLAIESDVRFQLVDEIVCIHSISGEDRR